VKIFGGIFIIPETKEIFGDDLCFTLRGCLLEKNGFNFRNDLAHGFLPADDLASVPAIYVWWLVLKILVLGMSKR
jgi:hypothetical protein